MSKKDVRVKVEMTLNIFNLKSDADVKGTVIDLLKAGIDFESEPEKVRIDVLNEQDA